MDDSQAARAARLREIRKERYETASDAARATGVKISTYTNHENGTAGITRNAMIYSSHFRVSLDWLLSGRGERKIADTESREQRLLDAFRLATPEVQRIVEGFLRDGASAAAIGPKHANDVRPAVGSRRADAADPDTTLGSRLAASRVPQRLGHRPIIGPTR